MLVANRAVFCPAMATSIQRDLLTEQVTPLVSFGTHVSYSPIQHENIFSSRLTEIKKEWVDVSIWRGSWMGLTLIRHRRFLLTEKSGFQPNLFIRSLIGNQTLSGSNGRGQTLCPPASHCCRDKEPLATQTSPAE